MSTTTTTSDEAAETARLTRRQLQNSRGDIVHLVCCRAPTWDVAICGMEAGNIDLAAEVLCTMCADEAEDRLPGWSTKDPRLCPWERRPCPDDHELDLRILREVSPS